MNAECVRIADQLQRAFHGNAWHGAPLRDLLAGVTAEQACRRPLPSGHTIWELVLHTSAWVNAASDATEGIPMPKLVGTEADWPHIPIESETAWNQAKEHLLASGERLAQAIARFDDARLQQAVPGRDYDFYHLFHGVVQHSLYHGGQIALLRTDRTGSRTQA
jgi:hypothetical protein